VPRATGQAYSSTPLPKKLGIGEGSTVALLGAPDDVEQTLGALPEGAILRRSTRGRFDLLLWFVRSKAELARGIDSIAGRSKGLWILWPKKASGMATDVGERDVRETGLAAGLVDYKICAFDATWSGLKFAVKKSSAR
jgi:hypothetical protein